MRNKALPIRMAGILTMAIILSSCGTAKERTAPCKRSTMASSFAEETGCQDWGPVNKSEALQAINQILAE